MTDHSQQTDWLPKGAAQQRLRFWRTFKDRLATWGMGIGGSAVIVAIALIFFYLLYVVFPLFVPPASGVLTRLSLPAADRGATLHLSMEEQNRIGTRFTDQGTVVFFSLEDGQVIETHDLIPAGAPPLTAIGHGDLSGNVIATGQQDGTVRLFRTHYKVRFDGDTKLVEAGLEQILADQTIKMGDKPVSVIGLRDSEDKVVIGAAQDQNLSIVQFVKSESLLLSDEETTYEQFSSVIPTAADIVSIIVAMDQRRLFAALATGEVLMIDISTPGEAWLMNRVRVVKPGQNLTAFSGLTGGISMLAGSDNGEISQWFPAPDANGDERLQLIREFEPMPVAVTAIVTEQRRKGFFALDAGGNLGVYHATANRQLIQEKYADPAPVALAVSPRANRFLIENADGAMVVGEVHNEHPEISFSVLWDKVWYESYDEPQYIWQSSSASNDFEPKFSLMPLTFGTIKAAFYAMLFAIPLAILGAIYTAYFMSPKMRTYVKPSIEIMEALPTVILGFLCGLWLAPAMEKNLSGTFLLLLTLPPGVLLSSLAWNYVPEQLRSRIPDGWQGALLIIPVLLIIWISLSLGSVLEVYVFDGSLAHWMSVELGWSYDQRNSLVVGIAMGVAVIPTIFSIAEDAIFSVPKHLTLGSLALGATTWQTMVRVVILTASPGIFSAVMIGLGRAVGETMIVLMATGNTPVMDMSIFQGMRTLSANIAVEMPESEVDSTHYRILFLAALVLFVITFLFNTLAEVVRQRLRRKYSSL